MPEKIKISKGITFEGTMSWLGFLIMGIGLFLILLSVIFKNTLLIIFAIVLTSIGISLFLQIKSVVFDITQNKVGFLNHLLFWKSGKWMPFDDISGLEVDLHISRTKIDMATLPRDSSSRTFDVNLVKKDGTKLLVKDFNNYLKAIELGNQLTNKTDLELTDKYRLRRQSAQKRRQFTR